MVLQNSFIGFARGIYLVVIGSLGKVLVWLKPARTTVNFPSLHSSSWRRSWR